MSDRIPRSWRSLVACSLLVLGVTACGSSAKKATTEPEPSTPADAAPAVVPDAVPAPTGPGVELRIDHPDAEVFVDGGRVGLASDLGASGGFIALEAGIHQISVHKPGFNTWRAEVSVRDQPETIQVNLEPAAEP